MTLSSAVHRLVQRCGPAGLAPKEAAALLRSGRAILVDVGEPSDWQQGVAKNAVRLPLSDFRGSREVWAPFLARASGAPLLVYHRTCTATAAAVHELQAAGINAVDAGTLQEWDGAGWPVCRPRRSG